MKRFGISIIGCLIIFSCAGQRPENIGASIGRLTGCPAKPNCVSSQAADNEHAIAPFRYHGEKKDAFNRLKKIIASFERMTIVAENDRYLHIECTSSIMRFIDDLEFSFLEEKEIHVRSASRIGYYDFGANRKRVEKLRKLFATQLTSIEK